MVWLVAGLPIASVIASFALLAVAIRSGGADVVGDRVQRTAQVQVTDLDPDRRAGLLKLTAVLRVEEGSIEVLPVSGRFDRAVPLRVALRHPAQANADRRLLLAPTVRGWSGELDLAGSNDWRLEVTDDAASWRLRGRLPKGLQAAHLKPALGPG